MRTQSAETKEGTENFQPFKMAKVVVAKDKTHNNHVDVCQSLVGHSLLWPDFV